MFCTKCGSKLDDNARFCTNCGSRIGDSLPKAQQAPAPVFSVPETPPVSETAQTPVPNPAPVSEAVQTPAPEPIPVPEEVQAPETKKGAKETFDKAKKTLQTAERLMTAVPNMPGEFTLGSLKSIPGPGNVLSGGVRNLFSSLKSFFRNPKAMIPTLAISAVWILLGILKSAGVTGDVMTFFSGLTFSNAGLTSKAAGIIGGVLGKGVFAGALVTLVGMISRIGKKKNTEKRGLLQTLKGSFGFDKDTLWGYILGLGASLALFVFFSGNNVDGTSVMGGAAASFMSARTALNGGFVSRFISSFERKSETKTLSAVPRGMAAGFALGAALGFIKNFTTPLLIIGLAVTAGGIVMLILQKTGVVVLGRKEADAA